MLNGSLLLGEWVKFSFHKVGVNFKIYTFLLIKLKNK